ncbi:hypothetical protein [Tenacibaculum maritimum]|uniref:hypothetical protein n=1 Tax=Tenacibaculum maritimum TaxID=107401 RepID=UPI0012E638CB|nr:hypothetical protein [Tenacibaculum maritimum]CAA0180262.1 conserved hypothetical protein [Tenacibaculum maritimum]
MKLPKFLLADNSNYPEDVFVLHTEFPRFLMNLKNDDVEWFDDLVGTDENEMANEVATLMDQAGEFYDEEIKSLE